MAVAQCSITILSLLIIHLTFLADGTGIGVNYGLKADNLPPPPQVVSLLKSRNVGKIRLFNPDQNVLNALKDSGIQVVLGTLNADIPNLANDINFAKTWVETNVVPYASTVTFLCISVGNEVHAGELTSTVLPAIKNLHEALKSVNLGQIPVTTTIGIYLLASSYPPSTGDFPENIKPAMQEILRFLSDNWFPVLATVYPYIALASTPSTIPLSYALLNSTEVVVRDGNLNYANLFDAMVDAMYWALEKNGGGWVGVMVCESGWPSNGNGDYTTPMMAQTYNQHLVNHILNSGTPKKPSNLIETYIFALFNEDQKSPGVEQNWGLYYPNMSEVYHIDFS